jgi:hypothetical protein
MGVFMKIKKLYFLLSLLILPACIKTYKLVPPEAPQGKEHADSRAIVKNYVRSAKLYEEWETRAFFDVLWLSDQALTSYVNLYCARGGKGAAQRDAMLKNELSRHKNYLTFYVLADVRDKLHPDLKDKDAAWKMHLDVDGKKIIPIKDGIKEIEISPELQSFFGYKYRRPKFKTAYVVKFPFSDVSGKPFKMIISSVHRQCELGWQGGHPVMIKNLRREKMKPGKFKKDEDYYWL